MDWLKPLWVKLWLLAASSVLLTITLLIGFFTVLDLWLRHQAQAAMPEPVRAEIARLEAAGQTLGPRYEAIYGQYLEPYNPINDTAAMVLLLVCAVAITGAFAFVLARRISAPISSVALAADRIGQGELDVRAATVGASGETAELVARFNAMADEIQSYERERRILTAGIAHELRTPLTVMKGRLHGIVDGVLPLDPSEVQRLLRHADQLSHLIDDLRTLAHVDAGELKLELGPVAVDALVLSVLDDLHERAAVSDVGLQLTGCGGMAVADPSRLRQIVTNLLANAIRHSPQGGVVVVHTQEADGSVVIAVEDSGEGLDTVTQEQMFVPFWRGTGGRAKDGSGSGLGLALALMLAEAQRGTLEGTNRAGGGAVFRLRLPLVRSA